MNTNSVTIWNTSLFEHRSRHQLRRRNNPADSRRVSICSSAVIMTTGAIRLIMETAIDMAILAIKVSMDIIDYEPGNGVGKIR